MMRKNEKAFFELVDRGVFKVYKNGKIYRCKKKITHEDEYKNCKPRLMNSNCNGYVNFNLDKKYSNVYVHRLIWIYFNGEIPEGLEINHKKGIRNDNRLSELELVTHKENCLHAFKIGLINQIGESHVWAKLSEKDVLKIKEMLKQKLTMAYIATFFKVSMGAISGIKYGKNWSHVKI